MDLTKDGSDSNDFKELVETDSRARFLKNKEFCVLNLDKSKYRTFACIDRAIIEYGNNIVACGGLTVMNPFRTIFLVIAEVDDIKVKAIHMRPDWNVVHKSWMDKCLGQNAYIPFGPDDLIVMSRATKFELKFKGNR